MKLADLQKLLALLRANGVTHYNTSDLEVRFTLDAGQTLTKPTGELGELGELAPEDESDVEEGAEDADGGDETDERLLKDIRAANFQHGGRT